MTIHGHELQQPGASIMGYKLILIASIALLIGGIQAEVPNEFKAGMPAIAAEINENFTSLDNAISNNAHQIQSNLEDLRLANQGLRSTRIDCSKDVTAFAAAMDNGYDKITIENGVCNGNISVFNRSVKVYGEGSAVIDTIDLGNGHTLSISNNSYVALRNIDVKGHIKLANGTTMELENVTLSCSGSGTGIEASSSIVTLKNTTMSGCPSIQAVRGSVLQFYQGNSIVGGLGVHNNSYANAMAGTLNISVQDNGERSSEAITVTSSSAAHFSNIVVQGSIRASTSTISLTGIEWLDTGSNEEKRIGSIDNSSVYINDVDLSNSSVGAFRNGVLTIDNVGSYTHFNSKVTINVNSSISIYGDILGDVFLNVWGNSYAQIWHQEDSVTVMNEANIQVGDFSSVHGSSSVNHTGSVDCHAYSSANINGIEQCP